MKKILSVLLCMLLIIGVMPVSSFAAETDFDLYYTYSDIQVNKTSADQRYGSNNNHISQQQLPSLNGGRAVYLAKNELEGFQAVFFEKGEGRTLDIEFTPFVNAQGEELECKVYNELFISSKGLTDHKLADILVPYNNEGVQTVTNENNVFFLELHSKKDQTAGNYVSTVTIKDENGVLGTQKITAVVWNFALPEGHLSTYLVGNYNSGSGYYTTSGFLRLAGIRFDKNGNVVAEDKERAEEILEAYDEFFLENGLTPYEIPAYLIEKDAKEAQLKMADPRRSMFMVPVVSFATSAGKFTNASTINSINSYKSVVSGNKYLEDKAFFYPADEQNWANEAAAAGYLSKIDAIKNIWGDDYHAIAPFNSITAPSYAFDVLKSTTDILCPNQGCVSSTNTTTDNESKRTLRAELGSDEWHKTLRYQGDTWQGNTYIWSWNRSTRGVFTRVLQWQASALDSDGMLHWNGLYVPNNADGTPYDVVKEGAMFGRQGITTGGGDGIFVYSGVSAGVDATTPLASLRLKHIQSGMDDYDYLSMVKEFLGEEAYTEYMNKFLRNYKEAGTDQIWYCERNEGNGWDGDWITWEVTTLNSARIAMGNALSAANTEHAYGEWEIAVGCDDTHNGLEIRTCADCGAQESRELNACESDGHNYETTTIPATCTTDGSVTEKCTRCGDTKVTVVNATGHKNTITVKEVPATCTTDGTSSGVYCNDCKTYISGHEVIKATGHKSDSGVVTKTASCTATGVKTYSCTVCKSVLKTETIAKRAHTEVAIPAVAATCTETGLTEGKKCSVCGTVLTAQKTVAKSAHSDNDSDGICDKCGTIITPAVDPKPCSCNCHKTGFMGFIWKIVNFFNRIFKTNPVCECGVKHY